jgi:hypothetical protein
MQRGGAPTARLGPHGARAGGGDRPAACGGPPQRRAARPPDHRPAAAGLLHDLRWVATYHDSWLSLGLELVAVLALRSLYAAWMVRRAGPPGRGAAPSFVLAAGRALVFYTTALGLFSPWGQQSGVGWGSSGLVRPAEGLLESSVWGRPGQPHVQRSGWLSMPLARLA